MDSSFKRLFAGLAVGAAFLALVAFPQWKDPEIIDLAQPDSAMFPGSYVNLAHGHTRYVLQGPADGQPVLLVGGLTTSLEFFDALAVDLSKAGFQTLQFDLYGRGGSARPYGVGYGQQTYVDQIDDLLRELNISQDVHIVGQSLGGGIAVAWAIENPSRVRSLSIHASAGYLEELPPGSGLINIPVLGDYVWWWIGNGFVTGNVANYFAKPEENSDAISALHSQFAEAEKVEGYRAAVLSTIRNFGANNMMEQFSQLSASTTPTQIIWGREDALIPVSSSTKLLEWIEGSPDLTVLDGIGHMPLLEDPDEVHGLVLGHVLENQGD